MLKENISLKDFNTMKTGGNARYFFTVESIKEVKEAIVFAKKNNAPVFVLGEGSNVLISDKGFDGVVIKMEIDGVVFEEIDESTVKVIAGAGVLWDDLVQETVNKDLYGLENLSLIPGTVGASSVQNIGAYGAEVKDTFAWAEVLNTETGEIKKITNKEAMFGYRESFFNSEGGKKFIILKVVFDLKKNGKLETDYKDLQDYFKEREMNPTLKKLRDAIIEIRTSKLPDMKKIGTAGSFFKNPTVSEEEVQKILKIYPNLKYFPIGDEVVKLSAAWLLDYVCGWKGKCMGNACVYENQALVLVNRGGSTTKEILTLANEMISDVKKKMGIELEIEVNIIK